MIFNCHLNRVFFSFDLGFEKDIEKKTVRMSDYKTLMWKERLIPENSF